jgi:hypothetical protein
MTVVPPFAHFSGAPGEPLSLSSQAFVFEPPPSSSCLSSTILADSVLLLLSPFSLLSFPPFLHSFPSPVPVLPGRYEHDLPESTEEHVIAKTKGFYSRFKSVSTSGTTPSAGDPGGERDRERERERDR